jgi:hypothetical protein
MGSQPRQEQERSQHGQAPTRGRPVGYSFGLAARPMRSDKEIRDEVRAIRERARSLSGFWIPELAAAAYALEWTLEKRPTRPSGDIGSAESAHGKLAESLLKAAETAGPPAAPKPTAVGKKKSGKPAARPKRSR